MALSSFPPLASSMEAMQFFQAGSPLRHVSLPVPRPGPGQVLLRVHACGVCRTDLHLIDGELPSPTIPIIPGHQIVGTIEELGAEVTSYHRGDRVGVPWLGWTCGHCTFCSLGRENLCDEAQFTGYQLNGGYAEYTLADERFCFPLPSFSSQEAAAHLAPLLCAGLIGYRALGFAGTARRLGFYGFGAAAHILTQVACHQKRDVYAFTRPGDKEGQRSAKTLGALWAGGSDELPPHPLDAAILFAPVGSLIPTALRATIKGGKVICAGIHMSDIPSFPYRLLWEERCLISVANLTRQDGYEFLQLASRIPLQTTITRFPLSQANEALEALRKGALHGSAVLIPSTG